MRVQFEQRPQKSGRPSVGGRLLQAVHGAGEHQSERVLARSVRAGKDDGMRKAVARQHLAQAMDGFRIADKIRKGHKEQLLALSS